MKATVMWYIINIHEVLQSDMFGDSSATVHCTLLVATHAVTFSMCKYGMCPMYQAAFSFWPS